MTHLTVNGEQYVVVFRYKSKSADEIDESATANYQINYLISGRAGCEPYALFDYQKLLYPFIILFYIFILLMDSFY
jgi:hypothetical protein